MERFNLKQLCLSAFVETLFNEIKVNFTFYSSFSNVSKVIGGRIGIVLLKVQKQ